VELVNPRQAAGFGRFAGLLVWLVPTLWFWVGRRLVDDRLAFRLLQLAAGATLAVSVYGIVQSVVGFPPWDRLWIDRRGYAALFIGPGTVRPFGSLASATEFSIVCGVAAVLAATAFYRPRLLTAPAELAAPADTRRAERRVHRRATAIRLIALAAFLIASLALVLSAVRTTLVFLIVALPVVYLVLRGRRAFMILLPALVVVALALLAIAQLNPDDLSQDGAMAAVRRVVVVIHDPFSGHSGSAADSNYGNTLSVHFDGIQHGFDEGFHHPFGRGTGSTGIVGDQFGGKTTSTDTDISDAGLAFGVLGLLVTIAIVVLGLAAAIRAALRIRTFERVALVGILIVSLGAWFQGAHYAMAPLLWLLLGRADSSARRDAEATTETEADGETGNVLDAAVVP
jgi:hypothetical protein